MWIDARPLRFGGKQLLNRGAFRNFVGHGLAIDGYLSMIRSLYRWAGVCKLIC